ncbi:MAG: DUF1343 domain-containing protein, partial [Muribaculaceae bacterium]|nr:DUF1343 domain-containing protein [Muribaculaceae bacterium]
MKNLAIITLLAVSALTACAGTSGSASSAPAASTEPLEAPVIVGAARTSFYVPLLQGKRIALLSNQTGMVDAEHHVLDVMIEKGLNVVTIFSPEHGFRGNADAGEHVSSSIDEKTGIPIASLYEGRSP